MSQLGQAAPVVIDLKPVSIETMPDDADGQVEFTVARMIRLANRDSSSQEIQHDAQTALQFGRGDALLGIHGFIRNHMSFVTDAAQSAPYTSLLPQGGNDVFVEAVTPPREISRIIAANGHAVGDCDDFSAYCAALLTALRIPCAFCTVAADAANPRDYSHVYVVAYVDGVRVPMDCSHGSYAGWETPSRFGRVREWPCSCGANSKRIDAVVGIALVAGLLWLYRAARSFAL